MKSIITFLILVFITINTYSQKFQSDYNIVVDYNGKERIEKKHTGTWVCYDTIMYQIYGPDTLKYKVYKIVNRDVYYVNDFDETVKVLFMQNGSVMRKNMTKSNQYLIYRKE
jgi:hypothetical protein